MVAGLLVALQDPSPRVKAAALEELALYEERSMVRPALDLCSHSDSQVAELARKLLHLPLAPDSTDVETLLDSGNSLTRWAAAEIALSGGLTSGSVLARLAEDPDMEPDTRRRLISRLGREANRDSAAALIRMAASGPRSLRIQALANLRNVSRYAQVTDLAPLCQDPDDGVARAAVEAVGFVGGTEAVPVVEKAERSDRPALRLGAYNAYASFDRPRYVRALRNAVKDPSEIVRHGVAQALDRTSPPDAFPAILPLLDDPIPNVRLAALLAYGRSGNAVALGILAEATRHADANLARLASNFIDRVGGIEELAVAMLLVPAPSRYDRARAVLRLSGMRGFYPLQFLVDRREGWDARLIEAADEVLAAMEDMRTLLRSSGSAEARQAEAGQLLRRAGSGEGQESELLRPYEAEWIRSDRELLDMTEGGIGGVIRRIFGKNPRAPGPDDPA